jgi:hypothetical protein
VHTAVSQRSRLGEHSESGRPSISTNMPGIENRPSRRARRNENISDRQVGACYVSQHRVSCGVLIAGSGSGAKRRRDDRIDPTPWQGKLAAMSLIKSRQLFLAVGVQQALQFKVSCHPCCSPSFPFLSKSSIVISYCTNS